MKTHFIRNIYLLFGMIGILSQFACNDEEDLGPAPRLFRPIAEVDNSIDNTLIAYFKAIEGVVSYQGEISMDSTFATVEQSVTVSPDTAEFTFEGTKYAYIQFSNLLAAQNYFIRIKAIHVDPSMNSEYFEVAAETYNIFVNPTDKEILDVAFKAKWDVGGELLSKIEVRHTETDELVATYWVLDAENESRVKIIDGLEGSSDYNVFLYSGDRLRGKGNITTKPAIEGPVVDLRFTESNTALWDVISTVESGHTILLKRGSTQIFPSAREISGSITVMSGYDFVDELAHIDLQGNPLTIPMNSHVDKIVFQDVAVTSDFEGDSYFFYLEDDRNIGTVEFNNISSQGHRGFFRVYGSNVSVDSLNINNCVIDSLREYGITHMDGATATINHINIKNSTFYYVIRPHYNRSAGVSENNTITYENCTFYNTPDNGRWWFDYSTGTDVTIKNCIFGKTEKLLSDGTPYWIKENTVSLTLQSSYMTNDFSPVSEPAPDLIPYSNSSYDLFTDPDNHDFTIKDGGFSGATSAGDPRWWNN